MMILTHPSYLGLARGFVHHSNSDSRTCQAVRQRRLRN